MVVPLSNGDVATFRSGGENAKVLAIAQPQDHGICIHTYIYIYMYIYICSYMRRQPSCILSVPDDAAANSGPPLSTEYLGPEPVAVAELDHPPDLLNGSGILMGFSYP